MIRYPLPVLLSTALLLSGCAAAPTAAPPPPQSGHGALPGATEAAEPQLQLVSVGPEGEVFRHSLISGQDTAMGTVSTAARVSSEGRYVFAADAAGVRILDSGAWTWDHGDHGHYYLAEPRTLGTVSGEGQATVATGLQAASGGTGLFFPDSGSAVLLKNADLAQGRLTESLRLELTPHAGLMAPLGDGAVVTDPGPDGGVARLRALDRDGQEVQAIACPAAQGTISTRAALVVGCADGAVLATGSGATASLHHVPYPVQAAAPATSFAARKGRPTVAGLGTDAGVWLLNTREARWHWLPTAERPVAATAVDDTEGHVLTVTPQGALHVHATALQGQHAATAPLVAASLADPALAAHLSLSVDADRAYLGAPAEGVVFEIDFADAARLARTLTLATPPLRLVETGQ